MLYSYTIEICSICTLVTMLGIIKNKKKYIQLLVQLNMKLFADVNMTMGIFSSDNATYELLVIIVSKAIHTVKFSKKSTNATCRLFILMLITDISQSRTQVIRNMICTQLY